MKKLLVLASLSTAFAALAFAGTAAARVAPDGGGAVSGQKGSSNSGPGSASSSNSSDAEAQGTATASADSTTVTIAGTGGSITCAVPAGLDLTPFLTGQIEAECELINGQLTLKEIKNETTGAKAEVQDDGTIEVSGDGADDEGVEGDDDQGEGVQGDDDQDDDDSGPGGGDDD